MLVGIMSDTHDRLDMLEKAVRIFKQRQVNMLIHCGDWVSPFTLDYFDHLRGDWPVPVKSVFGNNEGDIKRILLSNLQRTYPIEFASKLVMELDIDGRKAVIFHGHDQSILDALIHSQTYDIIITGHTHLPRNETVKQTLILNPGALCFVRDSRRITDASVALYNSLQHTAELIPLN